MTLASEKTREQQKKTWAVLKYDNETVGDFTKNLFTTNDIYSETLIWRVFKTFQSQDFKIKQSYIYFSVICS
jgi:hypothetical protein